MKKKQDRRRSRPAGKTDEKRAHEQGTARSDSSSQRLNLKRHKVAWIAGLFIAALTGAFLWGYPRWQLARAQAEMERWQFAEARDILERYPAWGSQPAKVQFLLARLHRQDLASFRAGVHLDKAHVGGFDPELVACERILIDAQNGKITSQSLAEMERLLSDFPNERPLIFEAFSSGLLGRRRQEQSLALIDRWIDEFPDDGRAYYCKAYSLSVMGQNERTLELYQEAARKSPRLVDAYLAMATIHADAGRHRDALNAYGQASQQAPEDVEIVLGQAEILWKMRRREEAAELLKPVSKMKVVPYPARRMLAQWYMGEGNEPNEVIRLLGPLLDQFPNSGRLNYLAAIANHKLGNESAFHVGMEQFFVANERVNELWFRKRHAKERGDLRELLGMASDCRTWAWEQELTWLKLASKAAPMSPNIHMLLARHHEERGSANNARRERNIAETLLILQQSRPR